MRSPFPPSKPSNSCSSPRIRRKPRDGYTARYSSLASRSRLGRLRVLSGRDVCKFSALVHESKLTRGGPCQEATHPPMLYDSGRPTLVI